MLQSGLSPSGAMRNYFHTAATAEPCRAAVYGAKPYDGVLFILSLWHYQNIPIPNNVVIVNISLRTYFNLLI